MSKVKTSSDLQPAALYLRRSTKKQKDSLEQQEEEVRAFAAERGYDIIAVYIDDGVSGAASLGVGRKSGRAASRKIRKGFLEMKADASAGKWKFLVCWEQFRATRSKPRHVIEELNPIADEGVKFIFLDLRSEPIDLDELTDLLQVALNAEQGNKELKITARRAIRGQHAKAAQGLHVAGPMPFAMKSDEVRDDAGNVLKNRKGDAVKGRIVPGDSAEDIETARLIFDWYDQGYTLRPIVKKLREERGLTMTDKRVLKILRHPYYVGDYVWNRSSKARFYAIRNGGIKKVNPDEDFDKTTDADQVTIRDNHQGIITREVFNRVQLKLVQNKSKTTPFANGGRQLLTGLCFCATCGNRFQGWSNRHDKLKLQCDGYRKGGVCKANYVNQVDVIASIITSVEELMGRENVTKQLERYRKKIKKQKQVDSPKELKAKIRKLNDSYEERMEHWRQMRDSDVDYDAAFLNDIANLAAPLKAEAAALEKRLKNLSRSVDDELDDLHEQLDRVDSLLDALKEAVTDPDEDSTPVIRSLLSSLVDRVDIEVGDRGKGRSPRFFIKYGKSSKSKITLNGGFNLLRAS